MSSIFKFPDKGSPQTLKTNKHTTNGHQYGITVLKYSMRQWSRQINNTMIKADLFDYSINVSMEGSCWHNIITQFLCMDVHLQKGQGTVYLSCNSVITSFAAHALKSSDLLFFLWHFSYWHQFCFQSDFCYTCSLVATNKRQVKCVFKEWNNMYTTESKSCKSTTCRG